VSSQIAIAETAESAIQPFYIEERSPAAFIGPYEPGALAANER